VAAAAAIVLAFAGGGWGVYSHIRVAPVPSALLEPQLPNGAGRFSTAGAMHVPQTVEGPVVTAPLTEKQNQRASKIPQSPKHAATNGKGHENAPGSEKQRKAVE